MRALLYVALACAPREFREEYREQIELDINERAQSDGLAAAYWNAFFNVLRVGVRLRFETVWRDLTYSARTLRKTPLFTAIVVGTLAIAIAANAGVFAVLNGLLLQPLPYPDSNHVFFVFGRYGSYIGNSVSYPDIQRIRAQSRTLAAIAVQSPSEDTLQGQSPIAVRGFTVGAQYFDALGVKPQIGRFFNDADLGKREAVISDRVWHLRYDADASAIGKPLHLASGTYTIVGVAGANLEVPDRVGLVPSDYWIPVDPRAPNVNADGYYIFDAIGRSRREATLDAVNADLTRIITQVARTHPDTHIAGGVMRTMGAVAVNRFVSMPISQVLFIAEIAVACVLLIACANVANLLLLRAENRRHELTVRAALGASRGAILNQVLAEAVLLAIAGGGLGLFISWVAIQALQPQDGIVPNVGHIAIDRNVVLYVCGLVVLVSIVTTVIAAFTPQRRGAFSVRGSAARRTGKVRALLTVAEVALAFALVVTSGLLVRSYWSLTHVPIGFSTRDLYEVELTGQLPAGKYASPQTVAQFAELSIRSLRQIPGVASAAAASTLPLLTSHPNDSFRIAGARAQPPFNWVYVVAVTPSYFSTLGLHVRAGHIFDDRSGQAAPVGVVNRAFEREFAPNYPHRSTVGLRLAMGGSLVSVAGIVSDARDSLAKSAQPTLYLPTLEDPNINEFLVRAQHVPSLAADITRALRSAEPQMSDPRIVPYSALVARNAAAARNVALLLTLLALIALVLAIGGIYGIMAYTVQQRTGEIGLRMALGASLAAVLRSVIFNAFTIAMAGIAIGFIVIAAGLRGQWVSALLYNVAPLDPTTLAVVLGLFFVCVLIASFIPAARAATVDPANALRYE